jgi:hypothetical protein
MTSGIGKQEVHPFGYLTTPEVVESMSADSTIEEASMNGQRQTNIGGIKKCVRASVRACAGAACIHGKDKLRTGYANIGSLQKNNHRVRRRQTSNVPLTGLRKPSNA